MSARYLYRCYDAGGQLLYIGSTINPRKRQSLHKTSATPRASRLLQKHMASFVVDSDAYPTEAAGLAAERAAIFTEQPIFNLQHRCVPSAQLLADVERYESGQPTTDWHAYMKRNDMHPSSTVRAALAGAAA